MPFNVQHGIGAIGRLGRLAYETGLGEANARRRARRSELKQQLNQQEFEAEQSELDRLAEADRDRQQYQMDVAQDQIDFAQELQENEQIQEHKLEAMRLEEELGRFSAQIKDQRQRRAAEQDAMEFLTNFDPEMIFDNAEDEMFASKVISAVKNRQLDAETAVDNIRERLRFVSAGKVPEKRRILMEQQRREEELAREQQEAQLQLMAKDAESRMDQILSRMEQAEQRADEAESLLIQDDTGDGAYQQTAQRARQRARMIRKALFYPMGEKFALEYVRTGRQIPSIEEAKEAWKRQMMSYGIVADDLEDANDSFQRFLAGMRSVLQ